jgi:hypothetical protein
MAPGFVLQLHEETAGVTSNVRAINTADHDIRLGRDF